MKTKSPNNSSNNLNNENSLYREFIHKFYEVFITLLQFLSVRKPFVSQDYRPISLLALFGNVQQVLIASELANDLTLQCLLSDKQYDFGIQSTFYRYFVLAAGSVMGICYCACISHLLYFFWINDYYESLFSTKLAYFGCVDVSWFDII